MVQKPNDGPAAVPCSIPKCDKIQPSVDIFPTRWPQIITISDDYGSTMGSTVVCCSSRTSTTTTDSTTHDYSAGSTFSPTIVNTG